MTINPIFKPLNIRWCFYHTMAPLIHSLTSRCNIPTLTLRCGETVLPPHISCAWVKRISMKILLWTKENAPVCSRATKQQILASLVVYTTARKILLVSWCRYLARNRKIIHIASSLVCQKAPQGSMVSNGAMVLATLDSPCPNGV